METENLFISCGANTAPGGILWLDMISSADTSRYLAYASHNMIALVNFTKKVFFLPLLILLWNGLLPSIETRVHFYWSCWTGFNNHFLSKSSQQFHRNREFCRRRDSYHLEALSQ